MQIQATLWQLQKLIVKCYYNIAIVLGLGRESNCPTLTPNEFLCFTQEHFHF